jgi:tRNA pseudouridine(38-40) synthase
MEHQSCTPHPLTVETNRPSQFSLQCLSFLLHRMPLYKFIVAYDGTRFHGFQRQIDNDTLTERMNDKALVASSRPKKRPHYDLLPKNTGIRKGCNISIQEILEMILFEMFPANLSVNQMALKFAGRTDKGVHARGQVCTVRLPSSIYCCGTNAKDSHAPYGDDDLASSEISRISSLPFHNHEFVNSNSYPYDVVCWKLRKDMNSRLPIDVSVQHVSCLTSNDDEHAIVLDPRRDVQLKQYTYTVRYRRIVSNDRQQDAAVTDMLDHSGPHAIRTAFDTACLWVVPWSINDAQMPFLCQQFVGENKNYYHFIHKAERQKCDASNILTIHRMEFEILNTTTECIYSPIPIDTSANVNHRTTTVSEIVTGRFILEAKSFRRTMIRNMVGYCIDVCRNLPTVPSIESVFPLTAPDTPTQQEQPFHLIINAAPASGLCLEWVKY